TTMPAGLTVEFTYDGNAWAPTNVGTYAVTGTVNDANYAGTAADSLVVSEGTATVFLQDLSQTYDGTARTVTATTMPAGLTVEFTYDGNTWAPTNAGSYAVTGTVNDANYQGSAAATLAVGKAAATVYLDGLSQTYDGTARTITATTMPAGLAVEFTYDGNAWAPTNAGSYAVTGTVNDANWQGSATDTLVVAKADQIIADFLPADGSTFVETNTVELSATASSGLEVTFAVLSGPGAIQDGTNLTFTGLGQVSLAARQQGDDNWNAASEVVHACTALGIFTITVESAHGTATPAAGAHEWVEGTVFTNQIETPDTQGSTQYVCNGWMATENLDPVGGVGTQALVTVNGDGTLTWLWTTNYRLATASAGNGSVQPESAWLAAGVATQVLAEADEYFVFANWTGDASGSNNPLALTMDAAKSVTANFAALYTTNRPTPLWWLAGHGITDDFEAAVNGDPDEDGIPTGDEWVMDTDPTNGASFLAFDAVWPLYGSNCWAVVWTNDEPPYDVVTNQECEIIGHVYQWRTSTGRVYGVQGAAGMHAPWLDLDGMTNLMPQGPELTVTNPATDPERMRHYRVRVRLP
ncbi:MAG TPA: MBG domain-containing protein, partial [Kiritimatiellia bacterium]|nr:MBG domain-containing protein [Kiritimatiellia bacterium]